MRLQSLRHSLSVFLPWKNTDLQSVVSSTPVGEHSPLRSEQARLSFFAESPKPLDPHTATAIEHIRHRAGARLLILIKRRVAKAAGQSRGLRLMARFDFPPSRLMQNKVNCTLLII